ncbi:hypothetical protein SHAM105786_14390 [Shewanella amazonensis]
MSKRPLLYKQSRSHFNLNKRLNSLDHGIGLTNFPVKTSTYPIKRPKKLNMHNVTFVFDFCGEYTCCGSKGLITEGFRHLFSA